MLTAYLENLRHASAGAQIASCVLSFLALGLGLFVPGFVTDHVRAYRSAR